MNCQTARETLELFRQEENLPEAGAEAQRHVGECSDCQESVAARRQLDVEIGRLCRDVPVPSALKERLLVGLASLDTAQAATADPNMQPRPSVPSLPAKVSRRRWLVRSSLAATCIVAAMATGVWWTRPAPPTLVLGEVTSQVLAADPAGFGKFEAFSRSVLLRKPKTMNTADLKRVAGQLGNQDVAVYVFDFTIRGQPCKGRLMVIPQASVIDAPHAISFLSEPSTYRQGYLCTAWAEGDLVYVCCVTCGDEALTRLMPRSA